MRDHTTVSHAMKKIKELIKEDEDFALLLEELSNKIKSKTSKKN
jgi:chromosomal replication initiator protein